MPDVLVLPGGTHMHDHPLVLEHKLILQVTSTPAPFLQCPPSPRCLHPLRVTLHQASFPA